MSAGVVVIGAGLGGLRTVEKLRRLAYGGPVTLIGAELHPPYDRPPLTKQVLRGERDSTVLRDDFDQLNVRLLLGRRATALDSANRRVTLDDGSDLSYDAAVLAPGGRPRRLPGIAPRPGLHVVRTIDDALGLRSAAAATGRVVVVGGGFIGCEVAASLRSRGAEVNLIELLSHPLARVLGDQGGAVVETLLQDRGVRVHTGRSVAQIVGDDHVTGVVLDDGTRLDTTEAVIGLGVVPDVDWLADSGVEIEDGIVCDAAGRTSVTDVYALGDAAGWIHPLAGGRRRVEHWTSTADQAAVVAAIITGDAEVALTEVPYFWSDLFDIKIQALGFVDPDADIARVVVDGRTVLLYSREGTVVAAVGFGAARAVMRLRPLIAAGRPLEEARSLVMR